MENFDKYLYPHQKIAISEKNKYDKCLINMWCGTGKTRTFTISLFQDNQDLNVIVFPSLGLINQYNNDYFLNQDNIFKDNFDNFQCLAFCSDDESKLNCKSNKINYSTSDIRLKTFIKKKENKIILVTYQSFEKFINICISNNIRINRLLFDEAHNLVGEKIQKIVFNNDELDNIVDKTEYYTATPVNRNGIIMYDRDEPENSDCGELAFEYLYYQAVEDKICKAFNTEISLYCQKPEYKNKYQPIFELIIRACLSGKYDYWNILTYHSYVNESDDKSEGISFVKDFASSKNEKLVKTLFTKIQNEEFPDTIELYNVDNVILKGVHSNTKNRQQILDDFDKSIEKGRIFILSSCGILNEGIDTKWANMGVPINPSQSIVKESQRIGRLVRIPELNMPDAVMLIPCMIDITQYNKMETDEDKDKMIREQLSESGNFNIALNVMSAFKYQYDPELYEMCLRYPNMYAPQEIKDNLAKYGLITKESQGELIDNLKYICEKEDILFEIETNTDMNDDELLELCSKNIDKRIEIYTQDYDEPVKFINRECVDDEPIRLFYSDDDKNYSPVIKKPEYKRIKKDAIKSPKKRKPIFNIHTHPDLDVLWKIKDIKLNKMFGKGVLDVNISWNVKKWNDKLQQVSKYIDTTNKLPLTTDKNEETKKLGQWLDRQRTIYKKNEGIMKNTVVKKSWEKFIDKYKVYLGDEFFINSTDLDIKCFAMTWNCGQPENRCKNTIVSKKHNLCKVHNDYYKNKHLLNYGYYTITGKDSIPDASICGGKKQIRNSNQNFTYENEEDVLLLKPMNKTILDIHYKYNYFDFNEYIKRLELTDKERTHMSKFYNPDDYNSKYDKDWNINYELLKTYMTKEKQCPVQRYKTDCDVKLGIWISKQRTNKKKNKLDKTKITKLESLTGWFWDLDEGWNINYELLKTYMIENNNQCPIRVYITEYGVKLGNWVSKQRQDKKKNKLDKTKINKLESLEGWFWELDLDECWNIKYELLKTYMIENNNQCPIRVYITEYGVKLGYWIHTQRQDKRKKILTQDRIDKLESLEGWFWEKKDMSKPNFQPKKETSNNKTKRLPPKSIMSELHKKYKTMTSENLHKHFQENPKDWEDYHKISKEKEKSFPTKEIPRNVIIEYLKELPGKKQKIIADLGCGEGEINDYFKNNNRFNFHNFDHVSCKSIIEKQDIKNTELEDYDVDICILSLAMWGSNCKDYITETNRILDTGGTLLIVEPYKRWCDNDERENKLVKLLEENNFTIISIIEKKFMFIEARKNN